MLQFQARYRDDGDRIRTITTEQAPLERVDDALDRHVLDVNESLGDFALGTGTQPTELILPETGTPKTSSYTGQDGLLHGTITPQNPGESEQQWQARHDAAHAALLVRFPAAS